jgi:hypothetical protein
MPAANMWAPEEEIVPPVTVHVAHTRHRHPELLEFAPGDHLSACDGVRLPATGPWKT